MTTLARGTTTIATNTTMAVAPILLQYTDMIATTTTTTPATTTMAMLMAVDLVGTQSLTYLSHVSSYA